MAELKSQPLPYVKTGILRQPLSGLTGISQKVSNMWTSLSSGIASSILNRSLGISGDSTASQGKEEELVDFGAMEPEIEYKPTLIDEDLETLYAGFQKRKKTKLDAGQKVNNAEDDIGASV